MELPEVKLSPDEIRYTLTDLINEFVRVEKNETGLEYQKQSNNIMGKINLITQLIGEKWDPTNHSYYKYLKYLVEKYELSVWCIDELFEQEPKELADNKSMLFFSPYWIIIGVLMFTWLLTSMLG